MQFAGQSGLYDRVPQKRWAEEGKCVFPVFLARDIADLAIIVHVRQIEDSTASRRRSRTSCGPVVV